MNDFSMDIDRCLAVLQIGGLILYPTDTVWGIGCDATNKKAVAKIYDLKQRSESKKMIVLMSTEKEVMQYVTHLDLSLFDYLAATTKPTSVIYDGVIGLAENILGEEGNVAIRICEDPFCKHLIKRFKKPIVSTSANISGDATPTFFSEIGNKIISGVDYVVEYKQDDKAPKEPSSVIKWNDKEGILVIRP